jgi:myosin heavy subunit
VEEEEDYLIPDIDDEDDFLLTQECMDDLGFSEDEKHDIFYIVSAVLLLGNIDFIDSNDGTDGSLVDKDCSIPTTPANITPF